MRAIEYAGMTPVEVLNHFRNRYYNDGDYIEKAIVADAINEVLPQIAAQQWIPVTQREPSEEAMKFFGEFGEWPEFLVMIKGGLVPTTLFFGPDEWFDSAENTYSVTHWMPLPKGPQEG